MERLAVKKDVDGASFITRFMAPPMPSPSRSAVRDLDTSIRAKASDGNMSSGTKRFLLSGLAIFTPPTVM